MSDTPRTDKACGWPVGHHGRIDSSDLKLSPDGPFVHSSVARELERENKQLRQTVLETLNQRGQRELIVAWDRAKELERENAALKLQIPALAAANDKLFMENLYLGKDKQRLDWLAVTDVWFDEPATESYTPETFRAEIDRKRKEAQP